MESDQKQRHHQDDGSSGPVSAQSEDRQNLRDGKEVAGGVVVVRSSTPRPLTMGPIASLQELALSGLQGDPSGVPGFPVKAPSAPPLPEELSDQEDEESAVTPIPQPSPPKEDFSGEQEFVWLFEYGLEMDATFLNRLDRLDGLALLYGPAVLKGYSIMFGTIEGYGGQEHGKRTLVTIVPGLDQEAEVWGVLYRIPRRVTEQVGGKPSLLNTVHVAIAPDNLYRPVQALVREIYHGREIQCVTYVATDAVRLQMRPLTIEQNSGDMLFVQRLAAIARKQKLPEHYLNAYLTYPAAVATIPRSERPPATVSAEQHTDPLPALLRSSSMATIEESRQGSAPAHNLWLVVFAVYLVVLLLVVLTFAVLQGLGWGSPALDRNFTLLDVPWMVLIYGLIGGCISSLSRLGRYYATNPPVFVIITWFTRPYIGATLALLTYLFLTSGIFVLDRSPGNHQPIFLLAAALAGLCEGWIFARRKIG